MIDHETAALKNLYSKTLVPKKCETCGKQYYVFRNERDKDDPIKACCVCQQGDPEYQETYQTASWLRGIGRR